MRVLGLIPARGGSKGIPRKNLRVVAGSPLISYTIESALAAKTLARVVVSTDDDEISEVAGSLGADVPFRRPADLARDETPMVDVLVHAIEQLGGTDAYDAVCLLQPTSPIRSGGLIDACVRAFEDATTFDSLVTMRRIPDEHHPSWAFSIDGDGALKLASGESEPPTARQTLAPAYHRSGALYLVRSAVLLEHHSLYGKRSLGYVLDDAEHVNIDDPSDLDAAEKLLSRSPS